MGELQNQQHDPAQIIEMLQRIKQQQESSDRSDDDGDEEQWDNLDSDDDECEIELAERLGDVDLNNADAVWERLNDAEKEEFKTIVHSGEIDRVVPSVEPYWKQKNACLVIEIGESEERIKAIEATCPAVKKDIKMFQQISSKPPAECVAYNVANVIGTYR
jgi:hypothetical protein